MSSMNKTLVTIPAHFDGQQIRLDAEISLKPQTRLLVTVLDEEPLHLRHVREAAALSEASLAAVWENEDDAVYDQL